MGGISGYFGGWIDNIIMRIVDVFYCIPSMPVIIIIGAAMDAMRVDSWKRMMYLDVYKRQATSRAIPRAIWPRA